MDTLADVIVAALDEAPAVLASEYPLGSYQGVNVDGLDPLKVAALHAQLADRAFDQLLEGYQPIAEASPTGPWQIRLPAELIKALAGISPQDIPAAAEAWATTEPVRQEGWSGQEAEKYLARVAHFARLAAYDQKEVFLIVYS
jgi:hypothetical protein